MSKTVVCLSTIPPRFNMVETVINSLSNQIRKPDKIYLHISKYYERFDVSASKKSLPFDIKKYPLLEVYEGEDCGPISKLFVGLLNENDDDTIIVTVDDDRIYNENMINLFEIQCDSDSDSSFGIRGRILNDQIKYCRSRTVHSVSVKQNTKVNIITAVQGWAHRRKFFNSEFIHEWKNARKKYPFIFFNDDIWISGQLETLNISKIVFPARNIGSRNLDGNNALFGTKEQIKRNEKNIQLFKDVWKII